MAKTMTLINLSGLERKFNFPIRIKHIGYINVERDKYIGVHRNSIEFCIRLKSSATHSIDWVGKECYTTAFPHLCIKQPPHLHRYDYVAKREAFFIIYSLEYRKELEKMGIDLNKIIRGFTLTPTIVNLINMIKDKLKETTIPGVVDTIDQLAFNLICNIYNSPPHDALQPQNEDDALRVNKIASYIKLHYKEDIDIESLIKRQGFSRRKFYRCWNEIFAVTPAKYIMQLKMHEACYLLENHSYTIEEIASRLHFADSAYFILIFKRYNLMTPLQYRHLKNNIKS